MMRSSVPRFDAQDYILAPISTSYVVLKDHDNACMCNDTDWAAQVWFTQFELGIAIVLYTGCRLYRQSLVSTIFCVAAMGL